MAIDLHSHVVHDSLTGDLQRPRLHVFEGERQQQRGQERRRNQVDAAQIAARDVAIDRNLHQPRLHELQRGSRDDCRQRDGHLGLVRPQVAEQAPHQHGVVSFSDNVFFVNRHQLAASSSSSCCFRKSSA